MNDSIKKPRRKRRLLVGVVTVALVAIAGVAYAVYLFNAGISGSVKAGNVSAVWQSASLDATNSANVCSAVTVTAGKAVITPGTGGYPGDACVISGGLKMAAGSSEDGYIAGLQMTVPVGWKATLLAGCGNQVPVSSGTAAVKVKIEMLATAVADGSSVSFTAPPTGVQVQPISQGAAPTVCPTTP